MGDRTFAMFRSHIGMTGLAMLNAFLEMLDPFIQMRILHILLSRLGMMNCFLSMLHQYIGMTLFTMRHRFLGMFHGFTHVLVLCKGEPAEQRETDKRGNRRNDQCSAIDSHFHGFLLSGYGLLDG